MPGSRDEDRLIVVVGSQERPVDQPRSGGPFRLGTVAVGLAIALAVAFAVRGDPVREPTPDTARPVLDMPGIGGVTPDREPVRAARGWRRLDLPGEGPVIAVDGSDRLWAALVRSPAPAAWVSTGAAIWRYRPLPDDAALGGDSWIEVSGSGELLVVTRPGDGAPSVQAWRSVDQGASWREVPIWDAADADVSGIATTSEGVLVFGSSGAAPAVWQLGDGRLRRMDFDADAAEGRVTAVVDRGGLTAFGTVGSDAAAWWLGRDSWSRTLVQTPFDQPVMAFGPVAVLDSTVLGVVTTMGFGSARLVQSSDLVTWDGGERSESIAVGALEAGSDRAVMVPDPAQRIGMFSVTTDGRAWQRVFADTSGSRVLRGGLFDDVAIAGDVVVLGGSRSGTPALWVQGPAPAPRWELGTDRGTGGTWTPVAAVQFPVEHDVSVAQAGNEVFYTSPDRLWWMPGVSDPGYVVPAGVAGVQRVFEVGGALFGLGPTSRRGVMVLAHRSDGGWRGQILWDGWIAGVTMIDREWVAFGETTDGTPITARSGDLEHWTFAEPSVRGRPAYLPLAFPAGILRSAGEGYEISRDGLTWLRVEGTPLGLTAGDPALNLGPAGPGTTRIRFLGGGEDLVVPVEGIVAAMRRGQTTAVIGEDALVLGSGGVWERIPLDLLHGVEGTVTDVAVGEDGGVVAFEQRPRLLRILKWRGR